MFCAPIVNTGKFIIGNIYTYLKTRGRGFWIITLFVLFLVVLCAYIIQKRYLGRAGRSILIGISCKSTDFHKRQIMRSVQIEPYKDYDITWKFILGKPPKLYEDAIEGENKIHNDLIILWDMEDTKENAKSVKPFVFFKYVEKNVSFHNYVAKMDEDTFMNIPEFWKRFFTPEIRASNRGVIGRILDMGGCTFPEGGFEAIAWDLMEAINRVYDPNKRDHVEEDKQIGRYFCNHSISIENFDMKYDAAFYYDPLVYDATKVCHSPLPDSVRIHNIKSEQDYLVVASCYSPGGYNQERVDYYKSVSWYKEPDFICSHPLG
jgi:hypothetical protein